MRVFARRSMKVLGIAIAVSPLAALALWAGSMSVVIVAPGAYWILAVIMVAPIVLSWGLYRLANFVR